MVSSGDVGEERGQGFEEITGTVSYISLSGGIVCYLRCACDCRLGYEESEIALH